MKIANNAVVSFTFNIRETGKDEIVAESEDGPSVYLHGHNNIFSAIETALEGKAKGDVLTTTLSPEEAYGEIETGKPPQRVPRKHITTKGKLTVGQVVGVNTAEGVQEATIVKVGLKNVDLDLNHPLAGKSLDFELTVTDVREASAEELAHGHVHGDGGHHH